MGIKTFRRSIKSSFRVLSVTVTLLFGQAYRPLWAHFNYNSSINGNTRELSNMVALIASAGVQWDFGHFIADAWFGSGPAFGRAADTLYEHGFELWQWFGSVNEHIAMSFTVRVGFCF